MLIAYFIGSIPTALWLGRWTQGKDIREYGSGNLGATNAFRVLGKRLGIAVLCLDMLKGLAPVALLPGLLHLRNASAADELWIGAAAIIGHVFSCFVNFRGGKGVATSVGVFLAIAPKAMLGLLAIGVLIIWLTGYVSAGAVAGALLLPVFFYFSGADPLVLFVGEIIALVVILRHKANLLRLLSGTESKIFPARTPDDEQPIKATSGYTATDPR